ncbi:hypothetical protein ACLM45_08755 [Synechococcus sp. A10-1-5-9]
MAAQDHHQCCRAGLSREEGIAERLREMAVNGELLPLEQGESRSGLRC